MTHSKFGEKNYLELLAEPVPFLPRSFNSCTDNARVLKRREEAVEERRLMRWEEGEGGHGEEKREVTGERIGERRGGDSREGRFQSGMRGKGRCEK